MSLFDDFGERLPYDSLCFSVLSLYAHSDSLSVRPSDVHGWDAMNRLLNQGYVELRGPYNWYLTRKGAKVSGQPYILNLRERRQAESVKTRPDNVSSKSVGASGYNPGPFDRIVQRPPMNAPYWPEGHDVYWMDTECTDPVTFNIGCRAVVTEEEPEPETFSELMEYCDEEISASNSSAALFERAHQWNGEYE